jgi:hypothetical protein
LGTLGYERKALRMGISLHWGSVGQPGVGWSTGDFERWIKEVLGMEGLSLKRLSVEGFVTGDPERYVK